MKNSRLARSVSIIGVYYTPMGVIGKSPEFEGLTEYELFADAAIGAMEDAGITANEVDAFYVGMCAPNYFNKVDSHAPHFADWIGMQNKPTLFHQEGCGTIQSGVEQAVYAVASGAYDCVMSAAVNCAGTSPYAGKPPFLRGTLPVEDMWGAVYTSVDPAYERIASVGTGSMEAWIFSYLKKNGYSAEDYDDAMCGYIQVMQKNAVSNPKALMATRTIDEEAAEVGLTADQYLKSNRYNPKTGSLVRARYLGMSVDGAAAVIVCETELAKKLCKKPIEIVGIGSGSSYEKTMYTSDHNKFAYKNALKMAGITDPYNEIDYMGIHDCTGGVVLNDAENLGYYKPGEVLRAMREQRITKDDPKPINTGGGRTCLGHPLAPAFACEIDEAVHQMRGENGDRQMPKVPKTSVITGGGAGFTWNEIILRSTAFVVKD
jgi:acetyl-CoA C-acetyltransferase